MLLSVQISYKYDCTQNHSAELNPIQWIVANYLAGNSSSQSLFKHFREGIVENLDCFLPIFPLTHIRCTQYISLSFISVSSMAFNLFGKWLSALDRVIVTWHNNRRANMSYGHAPYWRIREQHQKAQKFYFLSCGTCKYNFLSLTSVCVCSLDLMDSNSFTTIDKNKAKNGIDTYKNKQMCCNWCASRTQFELFDFLGIFVCHWCWCWCWSRLHKAHIFQQQPQQIYASPTTRCIHSGLTWRSLHLTAWSMAWRLFFFNPSSYTKCVFMIRLWR